jgi:tRNA G18 (ribose-2'-O)-methylase SpoU
MNSSGHVLILHDIRSAENVGAIFRTADAIGITKIYLSGYTPSPIDRFGRKRKDVAKSALGAEEAIPFEAAPDLNVLITSLKDAGYSIIAIEQSPQALNYRSVDIHGPAAFMFGNEVSGLSAETLLLADIIAEIPMRGEKESLNVSVSAGVALFGMLDR